MASTAPITGAADGAPPVFKINGVTPFRSETPIDYIVAAHAVACIGEGQAREDGEFYSTDEIMAGGFGAIALLLAHAERLIEQGYEA